MKRFRDQLNRPLHLGQRPQRIVCLVPSLTELLIDLGLEEELVGITKFCVEPAWLRKQKQIVGGTKKLHAAKVADLNPDLIICNKEENTPEIVEELGAIAPVYVSEIKNTRDLVDLLEDFGEIFEIRDKTDRLAEQIKKKESQYIMSLSEQPWLRIYYLIWKNPFMAAGKDTFIDHMLHLNKFQNLAQEKHDRYPKLELQEIFEKKPDYIFMSSEPYPFKEREKLELQSRLGIKVRLVDGTYFSWYGSRILQSYDYFRELRESLDA